VPDNDEQQIRHLITTWMSASKAGDTATVLTLMTDDVIFLRPGHPPMVGKSAFAAAATPPPGTPAPKVDGTCDIQEIQVLGDWAYIWTNLAVTITPAGGAESMRRAGHTLTILKKEAGRWLLARDANMLAPA